MVESELSKAFDTLSEEEKSELSIQMEKGLEEAFEGLVLDPETMKRMRASYEADKPLIDAILNPSAIKA